MVVLIGRGTGGPIRASTELLPFTQLHKSQINYYRG